MRTAGKWSLSPAYDLNPVPEIDRAQTPKTAITEEQESPSVALALAVASRFGLRDSEALGILREVLQAVLGWQTTARQLRMPAGSIAAYASAFEHPLIQETLEIAG